MSRRLRHPLRWTLAILAVVLVLGVVVPYVYINFIARKAPPSLAASTNAVAPATGTLAGGWVAAQGSEAGYRVQEVLNGQSATAVGRTTAVTGKVTLTSTKVTQAKVTVDLTTVTSDEPRRDGQFQGRIMQTSQYPTATFTLTGPIDLGPLATTAGSRSVKAEGTLALHGATRKVTVPLTVVRSGATLTVSGQIPVAFADYGIDNPSFGFVKTQDDGVIEILMHLTKA